MMTPTLSDLAKEINRRQIALTLLRREIAMLQTTSNAGTVPAPTVTSMEERIRAMLRERMAARDERQSI